MYFANTEKLYQNLEKHRGWYAEVTIDKKDGEERRLAGVICLSKGTILINESEEVSDPDFKMVPLTRVKKIFINGIVYKPKETLCPD